MSRVIYVANDNLLRVDRLRDAEDGSFLNAATVTAHLRNRDGTDVGGQAWPLTLGYVAGSEGRYHGTLSDGMTLKAGRKVFATVVADAGEGRRAEFVVELAAAVREV